MPSASEILNGNSQNILRLWKKRAREEASMHSGIAVSSDHLVLEKGLPDYLNNLLGNLSFPTMMGRLNKHSSSHKSSSKKEIKRVSQLLEEYHILRQVIFQTLEGEGRLDSSEREIINDYIDEAVAESTVNEFLEVMKGMQEKMAINLIHDLRTPITVAKLSADIIKMNPDQPEVCLKNAKRIQRSMEKMEKMVSSLVNLTDINIDKNIEKNTH